MNVSLNIALLRFNEKHHTKNLLLCRYINALTSYSPIWLSPIWKKQSSADAPSNLSVWLDQKTEGILNQTHSGIYARVGISVDIGMPRCEFRQDLHQINCQRRERRERIHDKYTAAARHQSSLIRCSSPGVGRYGEVASRADSSDRR